ncbi:MAG: hypoxanthine phosphoribosyltransferase [Fischerella sp.]|nr:hypoxanthine phosphoribosyltransferase [Fischerella sp.]
MCTVFGNRFYFTGEAMEAKLVPLISQAEISATVSRLSQELDRDYRHRSPVLVGILKGSFIFLADLARSMQTPISNIEFIRLSSYGSSTVSPGKASIIMGLSEEVVKGHDIILVEDIVDTGITTATALDFLNSYQPASLKLCALLDKPARRKVPVTIDYLGFTVPDHFVVGYGIDFDCKYRQLPAIYYILTE